MKLSDLLIYQFFKHLLVPQRILVLLTLIFLLTSNNAFSALPIDETNKNIEEESEVILFINCPFTMVIQCDESTDPSNTGTATVSGDDPGCDFPEVTITFTDVSSQEPALCPQYNYFITRTWTATNGCGTTVSCNQLIQVIDNTPPAITCPPDTDMECSDSSNPDINPALGHATSPGDNCSTADEIDIYFFDATDQGLNGCDAFNYTITRTWFASDVCDNINSCTQTITVSDTTPPTITCPAVSTISCDASTDPASIGTPTITDNCDSGIQATYTDVVVAGNACASSYSIERTWTAEDVCGNPSTCLQTILVTDNTAPVITCPPSSFATLTCNDALPAAATTAAELIAMGGTVTDNCSANEDLFVVSSISNNGGSFCPGSQYIVVRTYTVIDECGNASSCEQTFAYAESFTGPIITSVAPSCTKYCSSMFDPSASDIEYTTECGLGASVTISGPVVTGIIDCPNATYYYTYTVTDECGRTASATRAFLIDNDEPVIECQPYNLILDCGDPNNDNYIATHLSQVTATSSCNLDITISNNYSPQNGVLCGSPNVVTITATDACGRSVSCETTITILDNTSPVITNVPPSLCDEAECADNTDYWFNHWIDYMETGLEATDECGSVSWSTIPAVPVLNEDCDASGTAVTVVTWVATDDCGNTTTVTEDFIVNNDYPAQLENVPADQTIACDATPVFGPDPTVVHGCQTTLTFEDATDDSDPCAVVMTRTWTATDACGGLTATASQSITLVDDEAPVISGGADANAECDGLGNIGDFAAWLSSNAGATADDNCNDVTWSSDYDPANWVENSDCAGSVLSYVDVTFTATDDCNNSSSITKRFNIEDTTGPEFTFVPADAAVDCIDLVQFADANATDDCSTVTITHEDTSSGDNCNGSVTRTWTATDECGNTSTAQSTISYDDDEAPFFTYVPGDGAVDCIDFVMFEDATADDACNTATVTFEDTQNGDDCTGSITRTWTATDDCGNMSTAQSTISYDDDEAPVFTYVPDNGAAECIDFVTFEDATATDACNTATVTFEDTQSGDNCTGSITRTWTATDDCGNTATAQATITYDDNVPPVFTFVPNNSFVECYDDVQFDPAAAADLCSAVTLTHNDIMVGDNCVGSVTRTWTATDECGNTATASTTIEYADYMPPVVSDVPPSLTIGCNDPMDFGPAPTFTDNCDDDVTVTFIDIETPGDCVNAGFLYTMERIWTGTDDCGFYAMANQTITVVDSGDPVFTYVPPIPDLDCHEDLTPEPPVAEDDCGIESLEITDTDINGDLCDDGYAAVYTWTATDLCGNTATVETTVWVNADTEAPVFTYVPPIPDLDCHEDLTPEPPVAEDACGNVVLEITDEDINGDLCDDGYAAVYTWTATDDCGNTATVETTVWVNADTEAPVFTFVPDGDLITCDEFPPTFGDVEVEDACGSVTLAYIDEAVGNPNGCIDGEDFDYRRVWTATDDCGNTSTAKQTFWVKYEEAPFANLSGVISNEDNEAVESVTVNLEGNVPGGFYQYQTADDGAYAFTGLPLNSNYTIDPSLNENPLNGVSSFDLILIKKHLLNIQALDSPYKMIAADINNSGSISTFDLLQLRKLILYIDTEFQDNESWRFVEADFVFPDASNPFLATFPEVSNINGLLENEEHDFIAIKIGDVNGSAIPNSLLGGGDRDFDGELVFDIKDKKLTAGEVYEVAFKARDFIEVMGYQFTLNFESNLLAFESIGEEGLDEIMEANFGLSLLDESVLTTSWTHDQPKSLMDGTTIFSLRFTAKAGGYLSEALQVSSRFTKAESYAGRVAGGGVDLNEVVFRFESADEIEHRFKLYQNQPNPFHDETMISFNLPEASTATLTIYDVNGQAIKTISGDYKKGYNEELVSLKEIGETGVYYYRLLTPKRHLTRKMVMVRL